MNQLLQFVVHIVLVGLCFLLIWILALFAYRLTWHPLAKYPGPFLAKLSDFYGAYYNARGELHLKTWQAHQKWGTIVRQGPDKLVAFSATALNDIYHSKNVQKSKGYLPMLPAAGVYNIHTAIDKSIHKQKRKVIGQGLSDTNMRSFEPTMLGLIEVYLQNIATLTTQAPRDDGWSAPTNMAVHSKFLGYDIMSTFAFGQAFHLQTKSDNHFVLKTVEATSLRSGVYGQYPAIAKFNLEKLLYPQGAMMFERYKELMTKIVGARLQKGKNAQNDLFSFIIDAQDPDTGKDFTEQEVWSEARFLLIAGSDTASTTISASFFYLTRNTACYEKLAAEIRSTFSSASEIRVGSKLSQCQYLRACIDEAMRMSPPAGGTLWREVCEGGILVDGVFVPAGCDIGCSIYAVHHNEEYYPDSYAFKPERWIVSEDNSKEAVDLARMAFSPFSLGTRGCAGKTMAYMELSNVLAKTVWYFDFRRPEGPLGLVGEGGPGKRSGRHRIGEFQLCDHLTSSFDGPYVEFCLRKGYGTELLTAREGDQTL